MKKLIFLLLMIASLGCSDPELKMSSENKGGGTEVSPMVCVLLPPQGPPEPKLFLMTGGYPGPTLDYGESVTINWFSHDLYSPNDPVGDYTVLLTFKNLSAKPVKLWVSGTYIGLLSAGATYTKTFTGDCDGCVGPACPDSVSGVVTFKINTANGQYASCSADVEIKFYVTDGFNIPALADATVFPYTFVNQAC